MNESQGSTVEEDIEKTEERWFNWRALAGYVYLSICLFDFVVMPALVYMSNQETKNVIIELLQARTEHSFVLDMIDRVEEGQWHPVTLIGGGLFHISFGAILTGVAVTRGQERAEIVKTSNNR